MTTTSTPAMFIDGTAWDDNYVVICGGRRDGHAFLVKRPCGLTVECPTCGRTESAADLIAQFCLSRPRTAFASEGGAARPHARAS
ncbi:MAG: hypothetical protein ACE5Q3_05405 [Alphaproteobacteria bacterium]